MTQPYRTPSGGRIDRDQPIRFTFDGRSFDGYAGDTLASALLAHGVHLVGRSFKYHRPRGIMSAGSEEPNALVTIDRGDGRVTPNLRATTVELYEGLNARTQNAWPSVRFDLGAIAGFAGAAAVGRILLQDVHVAGVVLAASLRTRHPCRRRVGSGAARPGSGSLSASLRTLRRAGDRRRSRRPRRGSGGRRRRRAVILCDEQAEPGGSLLSRPDTRIDGLAASDWIAASLGDAHDRPAPHDRVWLVSRQHDRSGRTGDRSRSRGPTPICRASGCGWCGRSGSSSRPARSSGRRYFPATIGQASCSPARRRRICIVTVSCPAAESS